MRGSATGSLKTYCPRYRDANFARNDSATVYYKQKYFFTELSWRGLTDSSMAIEMVAIPSGWRG
jgi:hypothetical protein